MNLRQRITEDLKIAMRAGDTKRRDTIRLLQAAIKQREVDERIELDDGAIVAVLEKMLKQRKDSITQYEAAERMDLATIERDEVSILQAYMPQPLSDVEIECMVDEAIAVTGVKTMKDMGQVMAILKPKLAGRADMARVSALVKTRIAI
ncbi:hypothetical protein SAMN05216419_100517 [Nitrosomonas cryotolerans]|uniref:Glutamyl-tRNA amidotransferase n=1 Tax=Nitrosomonas cryotolerans ATCC 49181 TaxID=1131553 RepID=A0A1N6G8D0_9PROT|nr:GatB/YqeY domain-containing protein [Nitrosomonas cryotolerans]SFP51350.1 hypothetical protein SAMN05216419_100517 [Nitrosomonas cryotolerans]SIO03785.1 hypothetical protein SAMN02743940_0597 [Nitrosomonas cryotolerans ATCC 49181]